MQEMTAIHASLCALSFPPSVDMIPYDTHSVLTGCNSDCFCSVSDWDPICGENGITYVSPCLAGCTSSAGSGKNTVSYQDIVFYSNPQPCGQTFSLVFVCLYPSIWLCICGVCVTVSACLPRCSLTVAASVLPATLRPVRVSANTLTTVTGCSRTSWLSRSSLPLLFPLEEHQATWFSSGQIKSSF